MANILVIEDNETLREGMAQIISKMGHQVSCAPTGETGMNAFDQSRFDCVITDLKMPGMSGMDVLKAVKQKAPQTVIMIVTAYGTIELAVEAIRGGAHDFITKPFSPQVLRVKVDKALEMHSLHCERERLREENLSLKDALRPAPGRKMIGESPAIRGILQTIEKVARTDSTVYIYGESGTGKELVAEALHEQSTRCDGPFIRVNCGALPDTLLESELFGHEKGSFTGAVRRKIGRFELAHQGTILLDEIGDVSPALQLKLLRILQEREFDRVGGEETIRVNVRVIASTNKDLKVEVERGNFRKDLFYRLHIIPIHVPPLRQRVDDIPLLVQHFIAKLGPRTNINVKTITNRALTLMKRYTWPGNIRELENAIEQALVFAESDAIDVADLPQHLASAHHEQALTLPAEEKALPDVLEELEKQLILRAYEQAEGVKTDTARRLGIKTSALYYKLEKYGIGDKSE